MKLKQTEWAGWDWKRTLALLVGGALLIRLWGTWYGLPFSYYSDEYHEVMRALELGMGSFNLERTGKGGFYFVLFVEYGLYYVFLKLAGTIATPQDFAKLFVSDPSAFYLMGRMTAAIVGSMTVAAAFYLARRAYSTTAGLLAALFVAVNALHIDLSRLIGVDVPMTLLATCSLYFGVRIAEKGGRSNYLLAALFAALATTTKVTAVLLLLPLLIAHTYAVTKAATGLGGWFRTRDLWLALAVFVIVLVGTNPGIVDVMGYLDIFTNPPNQVMDEAAIGDAEISGGSRPNLYAYYFFIMQASMGWPLFVAGLASAAYALWRRTPADVMLLTYAIVNYFVISSTTSETLYYPRYTLTIIIVVAVLTGRAIADLTSVVMTRRRVAATAVIVAVCIASPLEQSASSAYLLTLVDTRTLARDWFEANVPTGSRVLIEGLKIWPVKTTVQLHETREAMQRRIEYWKSQEPKQAKFLELQWAVHEGGGYELEFVGFDSLATLDEYASEGIEYFVVRPVFFRASRGSDGSRARLLDELRSDTRVTLIKRFESDQDQRGGPTIEIYRLQEKVGETAADRP